jgi:hypothetical protein
MRSPFFGSRSHRILHDGYAHGFRHLFSPEAPVGLIEVPAITAYAAVTLPFCVLGDILGVNRRERIAEEIRILP